MSKSTLGSLGSDKIGSCFEFTVQYCTACEDGQGVCAQLMVVFSVLLVTITLPFSLLFVVKVVQEYERAVMFRWPSWLADLTLVSPGWGCY